MVSNIDGVSRCDESGSHDTSINGLLLTIAHISVINVVSSPSLSLQKHGIQYTLHCSNKSFLHSTHVWSMWRIKLPSSTTVGEKV